MGWSWYKVGKELWNKQTLARVGSRKTLSSSVEHILGDLQFNNNSYNNYWVAEINFKSIILIKVEFEKLKYQ